MPQVTLRTIVDGGEEVLTEYVCDWPGCPNVARHVVGRRTRLCMRAAVSAEHAVPLGPGGGLDSQRRWCARSVTRRRVSGAPF
ncbi:MAG TPA: hypothetical protein VKB50_06475 [Vicinamibacterales bacterium]|nr:hypothetical protein [Vicinamibacterales bacterium]